MTNPTDHLGSIAFREESGESLHHVLSNMDGCIALAEFADGTTRDVKIKDASPQRETFGLILVADTDESCEEEIGEPYVATLMSEGDNDIDPFIRKLTFY